MLRLSNDERVRARAIVIASGARYRRLDVENLRAIRGLERALLGIAAGGASCAPGRRSRWWARAIRRAKQRSIWPAKSAKVWLLVRGPDLSASMSRYLVDRIAGLANVEVVTQTEVTGLEGSDGMLEAIRWRCTASGEEVRRRIRHLFLFIGADPNTDWLSGSGVALDAKGFVLTGADAGSRRAAGDQSRGVFAIGDVRSGSIKRVAAAVGEGAQVVATLHAALTAIGTEPPGLRPT